MNLTMSNYLFILVVGGVFYCIFLSSQASEEVALPTSKSLLRKVFAWLFILIGLTGIFFGFYFLLSGKIQGNSKTIRANRLANENDAILLRVIDNDNFRKEASVHAEYETCYIRLCSELKEGIMTEKIIDESFDEFTRTGLLINNGTEVKIPVSEYFNHQYTLLQKRSISLDEKVKFLAMYTSIADKYNVNCAASWLDTKVKESINLDDKSLSIPKYVNIEDLTTDGKIELLESGYLSKKELKEKIETEEVIRAGYVNMMSTCFILGFIILGWGLYLKSFMKSPRPMWKKVGKAFTYVLATFAYLFIDTMIVFTICTTIFLMFVYVINSAINSNNEEKAIGKAEEKTITNIEPEVGITYKYDLASKSSSSMSFKTFLIRLLSSIALTAMLCILLLVMSEEIEVFYLLGIYIFYYLAYDIYYIYLIWRKREVKGEDVLLLPLLNRLGIYKSISDKGMQKRKLLKSMLPILIVSVISPILFYIFDENRLNTLAAFSFFLPFIAWGVFLIYAYTSKWLNNDRVSQDVSIKDEEPQFIYDYQSDLLCHSLYYSKPLKGTDYINDLSNIEMLETTSYDGCTIDDFMPHNQKECASNFYIYLIYRNCNLDNPLALEIKRRYEEAAHDGIYEAYNNLGVLQQKLENYGESVRYFKKAMEKGSFYAYVNIATHYCVQKEWNNFFKYNELAMETNNPKAIFNQAIAHHFGLNTDKNITKALSLYRRLLSLQPYDIKYNMEVTQEDIDIFKYYRLLTRHNLALMFIAGEIGEEWLEEFPLIRCNLRYILNADRKAYAKKYGDLILHGRDCYELSNEALANEELQDMECRLRKYYTSKNDY